MSRQFPELSEAELRQKIDGTPVNYPSAVKAGVPAVSRILIAQTFAGRYGFRDDTGREAMTHRDQTILFPHTRPIDATWSDLDVATLTLRHDDVARVATESTGIPAEMLRFDGGQPLSPDTEQQ